MSKGKVYVAYGSNGVGLHYDFFKAQDFRWCIKRLLVRKFNTMEEAETFALNHLREVVGPGIPIPDYIRLTEVKTISMVLRDAEEQKSKEARGNDV